MVSISCKGSGLPSGRQATSQVGAWLIQRAPAAASRGRCARSRSGDGFRAGRGGLGASPFSLGGRPGRQSDASAPNGGGVWRAKSDPFSRMHPFSRGAGMGGGRKGKPRPVTTPRRRPGVAGGASSAPPAFRWRGFPAVDTGGKERPARAGCDSLGQRPGLNDPMNSPP